MADRTGAELQRLDPRVEALAFEMLYAARSAGYPLVINALGGLRSEAQQRRLVTSGRSSTMNSKHLTGRAFDVDLYGWNRDRIPRWFWDLLGPWAEDGLNLRWGGRWKSRDFGHFELP